LGDFQFVGKTEALPIVELMARKDQASESQLALSMDYQVAIEKLATGDCSHALILFESILEKHPDDGPAKFHQAYCQQLLMQKESMPANPAIIQLDSK
jgi:adenylate cyclase